MTLPAEVRDLALRLGADPSRAAGQVTLTQAGSMKLRLEADLWFPFTARQNMSVTACAFSWQARFWPFGYLRVVDALEAGEGRMEVKLLGLVPLVRTRPSAALTKGELIRYLAELPFAPDAMLHNLALDWRVLDGNRLAVATGRGALRAEVILSLGPDGRVASVHATDRPRSATPPILPTPWHGCFSDYRQRQGRWVPFAGQVAWQIDGQDNLYWRGTLTGWSLLPGMSGATEPKPGKFLAGSLRVLPPLPQARPPAG
ncbi:hypothetical protein LHP98_13130 [Rhodobacter sp. Har01]|uniref:DUF6920 family protein n=1 Tax=Rhodobacter sp. Har01 TaxID=2883999 RepID=UPI001D08F211|nr:DUF6544 family protein [Rhodobacter sp. Har01]MCB6179062.1 hypothetical protein [Rhodobacter sp. Har01]